MNIITKKLNEIVPYKNNPRNNEQAIEPVANSIKEFGFKVPIIIDKNGVIVAGHTRYLASQKLGLEEVPCIVADDLTPKQIKAFRIADNKAAEKSDWDFSLLQTEIKDIADLGNDMTDFGFLDYEINGLLYEPEGYEEADSYIDKLMTETFSPREGAEEKEEFSVTFVFDKSVETNINALIKGKGKSYITEFIVAEAERYAEEKENENA